MNKEKAIQIFVELAIELKTVPSCCIALKQFIKDDNFSIAYQIHVPIFGKNFDKTPILKVVDTHQLSWKEQKDKIIIYKPL